MTDPNDDNETLGVFGGVQHSIRAHSNAIPVLLAAELFAAVRPRIISHWRDLGNEALTVLFLIYGLDLLGRGRLDENL